MPAERETLRPWPNHDPHYLGCTLDVSDMDECNCPDRAEPVAPELPHLENCENPAHCDHGANL